LSCHHHLARERPQFHGGFWPKMMIWNCRFRRTTRKRRPGEVEGKDYHFVTADDFHLMINNREMLEYAKVFDHYYGTPAAPVMAALGEGRDVLFDIDWQGTQQLADASREDLVSGIYSAAINARSGKTVVKPRPR
jgi:guanylate kinase